MKGREQLAPSALVFLITITSDVRDHRADFSDMKVETELFTSYEIL